MKLAIVRQRMWHAPGFSLRSPLLMAILTSFAIAADTMKAPGEPAIERLYLFQVKSAPSEEGRISVKVSDSGELSQEARLQLRVHELEGNVLSSESRTITGEFADFVIPSGMPEGGHRLEVQLRDGSEVLDMEERVYSVVERTAHDVRYGFYANFGDTGGDYLEKTNILVDCYLNAIEYYDWFPAHGNYTPDSAVYTQEPFGQTIRLDNLNGKIEEARAKRIRNIAYIAAYAGVPEIVNSIPDSHLTNQQGNWIAFYEGQVAPDVQLDGVWFYLTAFAPDTPWRAHLWDELTGVLDNSGLVLFEGFEIDTYGWNEPYYSPNSAYNGTPMAEMLADLTSDVRSLTNVYRLDGLTTLNAIAEEGIEELYDGSDFLFTENWDFHKPRYDQVANMVRLHTARSGKRLVSKCYPADIDGQYDTWPTTNLRYLMGAHLLGGGSFMAAGEPREDTGQIGGLNSLYYPDNQPQPEANFEVIRRYNAHDAVLYKRNHGPDVVAIATDLDIPGSMVASYRCDDGGMTWNILHLGDATRWTEASPPAGTLTDIAVDLTLPNGLVPAQVFHGTPDEEALVYPRAIEWTEENRTVSVVIPRLDTFASLIVTAQPLPTRLWDSAADPTYDEGWSTSTRGGSGWDSGWSFSGLTQSANVFVGNSYTNGGVEINYDADIDQGRRSWGLFSGASGLVDAVRPFSVLGPRESLRIEMDSGFVSTGGAVGLGLFGETGGPLMEWFFRGGDPAYRLADLGGETLTSTEFTDEGLDLEITMLTDREFSLRVIPIGRESETRTYSGTLTQSPTPRMKLRFFSYAAGVGPAHDVFFNDIRIYRLQPQPTGIAAWTLF